MAMNLAQYAQMPKNNGNGGEFLKWKTNGETKILRFLYTSHDGSDIEVVKKIWDDDQKKFVYDTPEGKLTCVLNAVIYEQGKEPRKVRWERSASFTEQVCNGYWAKFPRIIDGVWEVTCTNPGTKDIKFSWFPVMGADLTSFPLPEGVEVRDGKVFYEQEVKKESESPIPNRDAQPQQSSTSNPPPARKYWE